MEVSKEWDQIDEREICGPSASRNRGGPKAETEHVRGHVSQL
jgi:hypothetical protein